MSVARNFWNMRASKFQPLLRTIPRQQQPLSTSSHLFASGDYGSGTGDPVGETPQKQGPNPSADLEHPGPPPPKVGQGSGSSPTKGSSEGHNTGQSSGSPSSGGSGGSGSGDGGSSSSQQPSGSKKKGAQPKILNDAPPAEPDESVRQHNREMEQRAERANEKVEDQDVERDRVSKDYWSGIGGADRQP